MNHKKSSMEFQGRRVLVCNCEVSMPLDGQGLADALGTEAGEVLTQLCGAQLEALRTAAGEGRPLVVGCTQEAPRFDEALAEAAPGCKVSYTNIRERAGWSQEGAAALPKIAALLAEATLDVPATPTITLESRGTCLVYGEAEVAFDAARQLAPRLAVNLLLSDSGELIPPRTVNFPIARGRIRQAGGHFGAFTLEVENYAPMVASSRQALAFGPARQKLEIEADLILDLSGGSPLLPASEKRDGYVRPDPGNPALVQRALFDLVDLVGGFEKPRYVDFHDDLCAHSRSRRIGCTRCLDVCPASAIAPDGDVVQIDPALCGGCGLCNAVCPTGAADYAYPPADALLERARTLLATYCRAGGQQPVLLVHDEDPGAELISLISRFGRGLPARVIPFEVNEVTQLGLDWLLGAFAYGAQRVVILVPPRRQAEAEGFAAQLEIVDAALAGLGYGSGRIELLPAADPDEVEAHLHALDDPGSAVPAAEYLPMGGKRARMRLALGELHRAAPEPKDYVPLPAGAPFGRVVVATDGCTLCLACVGACPTGALQDNPERPQLAFLEDACVQCGLCVNTCPESVVGLESRLAFNDDARRAVVLKDEEPFLCIRCGKPFGTRSSIEKIVARLEGKHWMFQDAAAVDRIRMCDDCRVIVQLEAGDDPFRHGGPQRPRTTDDDLREREAEIEAARARVRAERESEER